MDIGQARERQRHCDGCERDLELDALKPGWTPAQVDGQWIWLCPDCSRAREVVSAP